MTCVFLVVLDFLIFSPSNFLVHVALFVDFVLESEICVRMRFHSHHTYVFGSVLRPHYDVMVMGGAKQQFSVEDQVFIKSFRSKDNCQTCVEFHLHLVGPHHLLSKKLPHTHRHILNWKYFHALSE